MSERKEVEKLEVFFPNFYFLYFFRGAVSPSCPLLLWVPFGHVPKDTFVSFREERREEERSKNAIFEVKNLERKEMKKQFLVKPLFKQGLQKKIKGGHGDKKNSPEKTGNLNRFASLRASPCW